MCRLRLVRAAHRLDGARARARVRQGGERAGERARPEANRGRTAGEPRCAADGDEVIRGGELRLCLIFAFLTWALS